MTRLYITDLDGTLLDRDSRVSPSSASIISHLSRQGTLISVATARTPATVEQLLAHTYTSIPAIVMTGAALWDRRTQRYTCIRYHSPHAVEAIGSLLDDVGIAPIYYSVSPDSPIVQCYHFARHPGKKEQKFINERRSLPLKRFHTIPGGVLPPDRLPLVTLIFAIGAMERIRHAADAISNHIDCSLTCYPDIFDPRTGYLEIFAPGVSKANAIATLRQITGADSLTVFGDNLNDLSMMAVADEAVAVGNALDHVKSHADIIIGPNTSDSVARYILDREGGSTL